MSALTGLDIHGDLRIRREGEQALYSSSGTARVPEDVADYVRDLRVRMEYAQAWVIQWRRQHGEVMERASGKDGAAHG